jgi:hypothetical protein
MLIFYNCLMILVIMMIKVGYLKYFPDILALYVHDL